CLKNYKLDPAWYFTTPGLAWDVMLKHSGIKLELLKDNDMILMIENGIRGGISQCSHRYAKANNKYIEGYDSTRDSKYIMYYDANNLYGWALSQPLPYEDFKWVSKEEMNKNKSNPNYGFILMVDLEYPEELHDYHNDLPLAPEKILPPGNKTEKLLCHFGKRERYTIHYKILKLYMKLGIKVTRLYKILQFKQSAFMKSYIDMNTALRAKATNDFEKDFFKLMNNSVFGKTMENIRNRQNIFFESNENRILNRVSKFNYKHYTIFSDNLIALHMYKTEIVFDKPIYVGFSVLDLSKILMYKFHYKIMKPKFSNIRLMYMDTDSFIYEISTYDIYEDMKEM
ncbi:hypothetical protein B4U79_01333, partial [Dinothrombium tinctorium]